MAKKGRVCRCGERLETERDLLDVTVQEGEHTVCRGTRKEERAFWDRILCEVPYRPPPTGILLPSSN